MGAEASGSTAMTKRSASCWAANARTGQDDRDGGVAERGGIGGGGDDRGAEAVGLTLHHRLQESLLAREVAVHGGPSAPGLPGDVVEGRLGDADPGDARSVASSTRAGRRSRDIGLTLIIL